MLKNENFFFTSKVYLMNEYVKYNKITDVEVRPIYY